MDCSDPAILGCIHDNPKTASAAFNSFWVFLVGAYVWYLSFRGSMHVTHSRGMGDWLSNLSWGIGGFLSSAWKRRGLLSLGRGVIAADNTTRLVYFIAAAWTVFAGLYFNDTNYFIGVGLVAAAYALALSVSSGFESTYVPVVFGGMLMGAAIVAVVWFARAFQLTPGNEVGDVVLVLGAAWIIVTLLAWYGATMRRGEHIPDREAHAEVITITASRTLPPAAAAASAARAEIAAEARKNFASAFAGMYKREKGARPTEAQTARAFETALRRYPGGRVPPPTPQSMHDMAVDAMGVLYPAARTRRRK